MTQSMYGLFSRRDWLGELSKQDKKLQFNNLLHHIDITLLQDAFLHLNRQAATGIDDRDWHAYRQNLPERLNQLHQRVQAGRYKALAVKRIWIPKANGEQRPIGITSIEDKIVQQAVVWILESIYEQDFMGFSYGFRPKRSQHKALDALYVAITQKQTGWVLDADLKAFFDTLDHNWLMQFLQHRIANKRVLNLIKGWLNAGVMDEQQWHKQQEGTPQGAVISPLLANIYLHYALDLWVHQWRKRYGKGDIHIVRTISMGSQSLAKGIKRKVKEI